jgi:hypothetical protein
MLLNIGQFDSTSEDAVSYEAVELPSGILLAVYLNVKPHLNVTTKQMSFK